MISCFQHIIACKLIGFAKINPAIDVKSDSQKWIHENCLMFDKGMSSFWANLLKMEYALVFDCIIFSPFWANLLKIEAGVCLSIYRLYWCNCRLLSSYRIYCITANQCYQYYTPCSPPMILLNTKLAWFFRFMLPKSFVTNNPNIQVWQKHFQFFQFEIFVKV